MGLFNWFLRTNTSGRSNSGMDIKLLREPRSKYYRLVQAISIILLVFGGVLIVLGFFAPPLQAHFDFVFKFSLVLIAVGVGGSIALPWVHFVERNKRLRTEEGREIPKLHNLVAAGFFILIGLCTALWVIAVFIVHVDTFENILHSFEASLEGSGEIVKDNSAVFLAFSIILTIQVLVATAIVTSMLRYKKQFMTLRVIAYITGIFIDLYASIIIGSFFSFNLVKNNGDGGVALSPFIDPQKMWWVILVLAAVGFLISTTILSTTIKKDRMRKAMMTGDMKSLAMTDEDFLDETASDKKRAAKAPVAPAAPAAPAQASVEEQLAKIQDLRDKGILTEEEYQAKRKDIIDKM